MVMVYFGIHENWKLILLSLMKSLDKKQRWIWLLRAG